MKKYLLILFLIVFIVPSVALASWWNPFSWFNNWTFQAKEVAPKTQVINTDSTSNSNAKIPVAKKETKKVVPIADNSTTSRIADNFNENSITSTKGVLTVFQSFEKEMDSAIQEIDGRISTITKIYNLQISQSDPAGLPSQYYVLSSKFTELLNQDIKLMKTYKDLLNSFKGYTNTYYPTLNNIIYTYPQKFISKEQSIKDIELNNEILTGLEKTYTNANGSIDAYNKHASSANKLDESVLEALVSYMTSAVGQNNTSSYNIPAPVYIQPIKFPQTTQCFAKGYGNIATIDCYTN